jgi:hypothetical protein
MTLTTNHFSSGHDSDSDSGPELKQLKHQENPPPLQEWHRIFSEVELEINRWIKVKLSAEFFYHFSFLPEFGVIILHFHGPFGLKYSEKHAVLFPNFPVYKLNFGLLWWVLIFMFINWVIQGKQRVRNWGWWYQVVTNGKQQGKKAWQHSHLLLSHTSPIPGFIWCLWNSLLV